MASSSGPGNQDATELPPEGDYATISYESNAFPQSDPARIFGFAKLFGLATPDLATMRVLELGCSTGGNIIPIAQRFPRARVLGIDLATRHVAEAQARIAALGLSNIEIRQADIASFDPGEEQFDAIICHGVYSWVPEAARAAILRIAGSHLTERGVAYVSYNVYPGWHLRSIIRDLMLYHAGAEGTAPPAERIAKARWVIENVSKITNAGTPYGAKLREEAAALTNWGDYYILGEFLVPHNEPCYFKDFMASAGAAGLTFLCESELETCIPETHGDEIGKMIRTMSGNQLVLLEQYIDFFMGRQFRQTLMVRKEHEARIERMLSPPRVAGLPFHGRLELSAEHSTEQSTTFRTPQGRTVTTSSLVVRRALERLAAAFPETRTAEELMAELRALGVKLTRVDEDAISETVFKMVVAGIVKPSLAPVRTGGAVGLRPVASPVARADAAAGRSHTTNLKHEAVIIDAVNRVLLPPLDGTAGRTELRSALKQAVESGVLKMTNDQTQQPVTGAALDKAITDHVELALKRMAEAALLLPEGPSGG